MIRSILMASMIALILSACGEPRSEAQEVQQKKEQKQFSIAKDVCGEGELAVLFVHGWCIDRSYWAPQTDHFCDKYKVISMDLPGFGGSGTGREEFSIEGYADDVIEVINDLGLDKVVLVGHSMAGDIIMESAIRDDRVIAIVGVDNFKNVGLEFNEQTDAQIQAFLDQMASNFPEVALQYAENGLFHAQTPGYVRDRVSTSISNTDPAVAVGSLKALFAYVPRETERLSHLKQKLYLINSTASPTLSTGLEASGVDYQKFDVGMTGHYPMAEDPEQFNSILERILAEVINKQ